MNETFNAGDRGYVTLQTERGKLLLAVVSGGGDECGAIALSADEAQIVVDFMKVGLAELQQA